MREELINFETAKLAKEKGFNHLKANVYGDNMAYDTGIEEGKLIVSGNALNYILAPTQALLQKWLREVHNIHVNPIPYSITFKETVYRCRITYFEDKMEQNKYIGLSIYENAFEIGLQEALKLIK